MRPFTPVEKEVVPDAPIWQKPDLISLLLEGGRYLLIAVAAFWLWSKVVKAGVDQLRRSGRARSGRTGSGQPLRRRR
jgi:flagellar biosynthesis/type III secretory pathway M-ring protein FliF/YscJ